jgi:hypothetical protein
MTIRARLFDADGADTEYDILAEGLVERDGRRLVWIDVDTRSDADLAPLGRRIPLASGLIQRLAHPTSAPAVHQYPDRVHLSVVSLEPDRDPEVVDIVAGADRADASSDRAGPPSAGATSRGFRGPRTSRHGAPRGPRPAVAGLARSIRGDD